MEITTTDFGEEALFPRRTVRVGGKEFHTPTNAIQIDDTRPHEQVDPDVRDVNEIYKQAKGSELREEREGQNSPIGSVLRRHLSKAESDEVNFCFLSYQESSTLPVADAATLVRLLKHHSDVLTVPLMPEMVDSIDGEGELSDPAYGSYKKSVRRFLEQADQIAPDMPLVGTIPLLDWELIDDLLDIYIQLGVRAFAVDFGRCRITADDQAEIIKPLVRYPVGRELEEHVLFYAINLNPKHYVSGRDSRGAADITAFGMGFDIVGGTHVSPPIPPEGFEGLQTGVFTLFDKSDYTYRDIPVDQLPAEFPSDSSFNPDHVAQRVRDSPKNARYRLQRLVNSEQMALAIEDLKEEIGEGAAVEFLASKIGVTEGVVGNMRAVKGGFDDERDQTDLSDF